VRHQLGTPKAFVASAFVPAPALSPKSQQKQERACYDIKHAECKDLPGKVYIQDAAILAEVPLQLLLCQDVADVHICAPQAVHLLQKVRGLKSGCD